MRVAFLHPDLGLGGAERLVVDAAAELAERGHQVEVYTAYHDPSRCFKETVDGTFAVKVHGGWFPRSICGRAHAFCAYVRCILVAFAIAWAAFRRKRNYDIVIADQVSAVIPFLHCLTDTKVLFYCHHPDLLLATRRPGLHRIYRQPIDWLEQVTTGQADHIVANSAYTAEIFEATFKTLHKRGITPGVLHPACTIPSPQSLGYVDRNWAKSLDANTAEILRRNPVFLSINRYERKKDIGLAIRALQKVLGGENGDSKQECTLVVAGGYDSRLAENVEHHAELQALAQDLGVKQHVLFITSFTDQQRSSLLAACNALLYTPTNEHFGIVPLEAMAACRPVIACNSGGPRETVLHLKTGFLCDANPTAFAAAMRRILADKHAARNLGQAARQHVQAKFSRSAFGDKLEAILRDMLKT